MAQHYISIPEGAIKSLRPVAGKETPLNISIPEGAIKSFTNSVFDYTELKFQYPKVRLKVGVLLPPLKGECISIPEGAIKR